jgi:hypothetical protein
MIDVNLEKQLLAQVESLPLELQRRVLEFALTLGQSALKGTPGRDLLRFAGSISPADAKLMMEAIESGCEQVDDNAW